MLLNPNGIQYLPFPVIALCGVSWSKCAPVTLVLHQVMGISDDDDALLGFITSGSLREQLIEQELL